jgi:hypothetical protein
MAIGLSFFMPVIACLANGQYSIVVLAAYAWCYALWHDGRRLAGGAVLALATVKFQLVAGFICVLLLKRKWKELAGFIAGCFPLIIISVMMVGVRGSLQYPRLLSELEKSTAVDPRHMANIRGLGRCCLA